MTPEQMCPPFFSRKSAFLFSSPFGQRAALSLNPLDARGSAVLTPPTASRHPPLFPPSVRPSVSLFAVCLHCSCRAIFASQTIGAILFLHAAIRCFPPESVLLAATIFQQRKRCTVIQNTYLRSLNGGKFTFFLASSALPPSRLAFILFQLMTLEIRHSCSLSLFLPYPSLLSVQTPIKIFFAVYLSLSLRVISGPLVSSDDH